MTLTKFPQTSIKESAHAPENLMRRGKPKLDIAFPLVMSEVGRLLLTNRDFDLNLQDGRIEGEIGLAMLQANFSERENTT